MQCPGWRRLVCWAMVAARLFSRVCRRCLDMAPPYTTRSFSPPLMVFVATNLAWSCQMVIRRLLVSPFSLLGQFISRGGYLSTSARSQAGLYCFPPAPSNTKPCHVSASSAWTTVRPLRWNSTAPLGHRKAFPVFMP